MIFGIIGALLGLGGAIFGAIGKAKASRAREAAAEVQTTELSKLEGMAVEDVYRVGAASMGNLRTAIGVSGVKLTNGSPLAAQVQSAANIERDVMRTRMQYQYEINQYKRQAQAERKTRPWDIGSTILGGVASAASMLPR